jgi:hypothetical protein
MRASSGLIHRCKRRAQNRALLDHLVGSDQQFVGDSVYRPHPGSKLGHVSYAPFATEFVRHFAMS